MNPTEKNLLLRKDLLLTVSPLIKLQTSKLQNMFIKGVKVFHPRNSLNNSGPLKLTVDSFQTKCLIPPDNAPKQNAK